MERLRPVRQGSQIIVDRGYYSQLGATSCARDFHPLERAHAGRIPKNTARVVRAAWSARSSLSTELGIN